MIRDGTGDGASNGDDGSMDVNNTSRIQSHTTSTSSASPVVDGMDVDQNDSNGGTSTAYAAAAGISADVVANVVGAAGAAAAAGNRLTIIPSASTSTTYRSDATRNAANKHLKAVFLISTDGSSRRVQVASTAEAIAFLKVSRTSVFWELPLFFWVVLSILHKSRGSCKRVSFPPPESTRVRSAIASSS